MRVSVTQRQEVQVLPCHSATLFILSISYVLYATYKFTHF